MPRAYTTGIDGWAVSPGGGLPGGLYAYGNVGAGYLAFDWAIPAGYGLHSVVFTYGFGTHYVMAMNASVYLGGVLANTREGGGIGQVSPTQNLMYGVGSVGYTFPRAMRSDEVSTMTLRVLGETGNQDGPWAYIASAYADYTISRVRSRIQVI